MDVELTCQDRKVAVAHCFNMAWLAGYQVLARCVAATARKKDTKKQQEHYATPPGALAGGQLERGTEKERETKARRARGAFLDQQNFR